MVGVLYYYTKAEPITEFKTPTLEEWQDLKSWEPSKFTKTYEEYTEQRRQVHEDNITKGYVYQVNSQFVEFEDQDDLNEKKEGFRESIEGLVAFTDDPGFELEVTRSKHKG